MHAQEARRKMLEAIAQSPEFQQIVKDITEAAEKDRDRIDHYGKMDNELITCLCDLGYTVIYSDMSESANISWSL